MGELTPTYIRHNAPNKGLYTENGRRVKYANLSEKKKEKVREHINNLTDKAFDYLKDKKVTMPTDNETIDVGFTKKNLKHFIRDAYMTLSGEHLSTANIKNIDALLRRAEYIKTSHTLIHGRTDGKMMFYKYRDTTGKEVYFKVAYEPRNGAGKQYVLYSVTNR